MKALVSDNASSPIASTAGAGIGASRALGCGPSQSEPRRARWAASSGWRWCIVEGARIARRARRNDGGEMQRLLRATHRPSARRRSRRRTAGCWRRNWPPVSGCAKRQRYSWAAGDADPRARRATMGHVPWRLGRWRGRRIARPTATDDGAAGAGTPDFRVLSRDATICFFRAWSSLRAAGALERWWGNAGALRAARIPIRQSVAATQNALLEPEEAARHRSPRSASHSPGRAGPGRGRGAHDGPRRVAGWLAAIRRRAAAAGAGGASRAACRSDSGARDEHGGGAFQRQSLGRALSEWRVIRPEQAARVLQSTRWRLRGHVPL